MRDVLKKFFTKQLKVTSKDVTYPDDLTDEEIKMALIGSIDKNISTIKNIVVGLVVVGVVVAIISVIPFLR